MTFNSAVIPATRGDEKRWQARDSQIKQTAREAKPNNRLVFLGDSITQGWEGRGKEVWKEFYESRGAVNLGIGGDRTEHVIWRLTHGNLGKLRPEVVVLMIGTNNTGHFMQDPTEVAEGVAEILKILHEKLPKTKVVLHGVFPRGETKFDAGRLNNITINQRIRRLADGERVRFLEIGDQFLESDGTVSREIMPDFLHLNETGYRRWAEALEPTLVELGL